MSKQVAAVLVCTFLALAGATVWVPMYKESWDPADGVTVRWVDQWFWMPIWRVGSSHGIASTGGACEWSWAPAWPVIVAEIVLVLVLGGALIALLGWQERRRQAGVARSWPVAAFSACAFLALLAAMVWVPTGLALRIGEPEEARDFTAPTYDFSWRYTETAPVVTTPYWNGALLHSRVIAWHLVAAELAAIAALGALALLILRARERRPGDGARWRLAAVVVGAGLALGASFTYVPVRAGTYGGPRPERWFAYTPLWPPQYMWSWQRESEETHRAQAQSFSAEILEERLSWPMLAAEHGLIIVLAGMGVVVLAHRERRRRAAEAIIPVAVPTGDPSVS